MERPKLRDFDKGTLASLDKHQIALIEWSWWAEDLIKEQKEQLSINGVVHWVAVKNGINPNYNVEILIKDKKGKVRIAVFSDWDNRFYDNTERENNLDEFVEYYTSMHRL